MPFQELLARRARDQAFVSSRVKAELTDRDVSRLQSIQRRTTDPSLQAAIDDLLAP